MSMIEVLMVTMSIVYFVASVWLAKTERTYRRFMRELKDSQSREKGAAFEQRGYFIKVVTGLVTRNLELSLELKKAKLRQSPVEANDE
jgi:hypothetical protein